MSFKVYYLQCTSCVYSFTYTKTLRQYRNTVKYCCFFYIISPHCMFLPEWTLAEDEVNSVGSTRQLKKWDAVGLLSVGNSGRRQQNDAILTLTYKQKCIFFILDSHRDEMIMIIWVPQLQRNNRGIFSVSSTCLFKCKAQHIISHGLLIKC